MYAEAKVGDKQTRGGGARREVGGTGMPGPFSMDVIAEIRRLAHYRPKFGQAGRRLVLAL